MAFKGQVEHSLDAKNRLSIPARYRAAFSSGIVLSKEVDACLAAWTPETQEQIVGKALEGVNELGSRYRAIKRYYHSNSFELELDSAGRVLVPPQLVDHAGIRKDVVVAGVGDHLEVWSRERWVEEESALEENIREVTEGLDNPS